MVILNKKNKSTFNPPLSSIKKNSGNDLYCRKMTGFTLIEIMIATALFVVIMILGIGVLLNVSKSHKSTQIMRSAMDNMSFVMEDMSRNIRLGSTFYCGDLATIDIGKTQSCPVYGTFPDLAFEGLYGDPKALNDQIVYRFYTDGIGSTTGYIQKSLDGGTSYKRITPSDIKIDLTKSGFTVVGAGADTLQTKVIIRIFGTVNYQNVSVPFNFQTTISPRNIDS